MANQPILHESILLSLIACSVGTGDVGDNGGPGDDALGGPDSGRSTRLYNVIGCKFLHLPEESDKLMKDYFHNSKLFTNK